MTCEIRDATAADLEAVSAINEDSVPAMNSLSMDELRWFLGTADYFRVAVIGDKVGGFLICLPPNADYDSPNLVWLNARYPRHLYIDRIAIGREFQRKGLGRALYDDAIKFASGSYELLTCEVNIRPRNQQSLDFHFAYGFEAVGSDDHGYAEVRYMIKQIGT